MTNPVNIVPKSDNDGSRIGRETRRWTNANIIDIKTNVLRILSRAIAPEVTDGALYVLNNQLFFNGAVINGISEEYIQDLIDASLSSIDFVDEAEATAIANNIAESVVNTAIGNLQIPVNISDLADVSAASPTEGDVLTWDGNNFIPQAPNDVVNNTLYVASSDTNGAINLAESEVLNIVGTSNQVDVQLSTGSGGQVFTISLPENINTKSSASLEADSLSAPFTLSLIDDASGSVSIDGSGNVDLSVSSVKATQLKTARTITLTGNASGSVSFDGTSNVSLSTTVSQATQANQLSTARTITLSGDVTGSQSFNGSANISIPVTVSKSDKIRTPRKITLSGDTSGAVYFDGSADVVLSTNVINSSTANQLASSKTISLTGATTGTVSTNFASNVSIATTIPANTFKTVLTSKVSSLLYRNKSGGDPYLPVSTNVFDTSISALLLEPVAVFFTQTGALSASHRLVGAYLFFQDGGVPGVSSDGSSYKIYEDYKFDLVQGAVALNGSITWGSVVATGYMLRSTPTANPYNGDRTDVSAVLTPPTGSTNIASNSVLGLFFSKVVTNHAGFIALSNLNPCAYGCTINVVLENLPLQA